MFHREQRNIVNISDITLTSEESSVLSRGLNFCPATGGYSEVQLLEYSDGFARNLGLREYFLDLPNLGDSRNSLATGRHWVPPSQHDRCLGIYIKAVKRDVLALYNTFRRNLSVSVMEATDFVSSRNDIGIKPADTGGAVVIMN